MKDFSEKCESPWNFSWIIPGFLAGTSCPQKDEHINFLMAEGIKHLVTLSPEYRPAISTKNCDLTRYDMPTEEFEAPSLDDMRRFIEICELCKSKHEPIAIHCRAGRGRTGTMAAIYFVHFFDMSPDMAVNKIRMMRPGSIETYQQEKAVASYRDWLRTSKKSQI